MCSHVISTNERGSFTYNSHLHANASSVHRERQTSLLVVKAIKAGMPVLNLPFSILSRVQSLFNNSLPFYSDDDKERKTWKGRVKERKKERGLRVKPSPETPLQHSHRERKRKREVKQEKK